MLIQNFQRKLGMLEAPEEGRVQRYVRKPAGTSVMAQSSDTGNTLPTHPLTAWYNFLNGSYWRPVR